MKFKDFDVRNKLDPQTQAACLLAVKAWTVLDCRDAGRVDIRFDSCNADAKPFVMEVSDSGVSFYELKLIKLQVNPISGLLPGHSPLAAGAHVSGIPFDELLAEIVDSAMRREQGTWTDNEPKSLLA